MAALRLADFDKTRSVHLSGIAGSAMNGLAVILRDLGFRVRGTDPRADTVRPLLSPLGVSVFTEQDGSRIAPDTGLVVVTQAMGPDHPELVAARSRDIPVMTYPQCLGALMETRIGAAVAGTHGKTTVTSMVVSVLRDLGVDPGFVIGGFVPALGSGAAAGSSDIFVAEACEFNRSFLDLRPRAAVINNIEADHLDVYKDLADIQGAFRKFAENVRDMDGTLIYSADCPNTPPVLAGLDLRTGTFSASGNETADYVARNIDETPAGARFELLKHGARQGEARLRVFGRHNIANALAAIALCDVLGVSLTAAMERLEGFEGAKRRFEVRDEAFGITVVDDYAHHPTAVRLLIETAKKRYAGRRIVLAFQPHQYSRTRQMLDAFAESLSFADEVVIPNIYFARDTEEDVRSLRPEALSEAVTARGTPARYIGDVNRAVEYLAASLMPNDVLLLAGAGDIDTFGPKVLEGLADRFRPSCIS